MQYISATQENQDLSALIDAVQLEPVTIKRQDQDAAVVLSPQEYKRLRGLNIAEFEKFCEKVGKRAEQKGLTEEKLAKLLEE